MLKSSKLPIGVATIYNPTSIFIILFVFIFLNSCSPVNYRLSKDDKTNVSQNTVVAQQKNINQTKVTIEKNTKVEKNTLLEEKFNQIIILNEISILLPKATKDKISEQFINIIELGIYNKKLQNLSFDINFYADQNELENIIQSKASPGKIFLGPLYSKESELLNKHCTKGVIFFSFSSQQNQAKNCVYLVNFFPENELKTLFNYFPKGSKVALLYPENSYGYTINKIIDEIAIFSNAVIVNRASYNEDLINVRNAIKELGKYELRKYELDRQKKILKIKNDNISKQRLKKLNKFKTTNDYDFTHIIIPDYGIRLLQVAPLLPYYDVDPDLVQFVGTGVWDDKVFFSEPSLQGAIFPGIQLDIRSELIEEYQQIYENKLMRISTLPYDILGLISYIITTKKTVKDIYFLLNEENIKFEGIDGGFYFNNNIIERDLDILKISNGKALKIN